MRALCQAVAFAAMSFLAVLVLLLHDTLADVSSEETCDPPPNADLVLFHRPDLHAASRAAAAVQWPTLSLQLGHCVVQSVSLLSLFRFYACVRSYLAIVGAQGVLLLGSHPFTSHNCSHRPSPSQLPRALASTAVPLHMIFECGCAILVMLCCGLGQTYLQSTAWFNLTVVALVKHTCKAPLGSTSL